MLKFQRPIFNPKGKYASKHMLLYGRLAYYFAQGSRQHSPQKNLNVAVYFNFF